MEREDESVLSPRAAQRWSLRRRLLVLLIAMTLGLWAASAVLMYFEALAEGGKLFDRSLSETGALLLRLAEHEITEHGPSMAVELLRAEANPAPKELRFQIWTQDLRASVVAGSPPERPFMALDAAGYAWADVNGERWRAFATWNDQHTLQVQVAEPLRRREELSSWTYVHLTGLAAALLPLSALGIWWILSRSIAPLRRSANAVAQRSPDDLELVAVDDAPAEVAPLLIALNRLLVRMRAALQRERRFTADAAHELRSPLAAVRANAQVLCAARTPAERDEVSANLLASVDRGSRLIDQLLTLARIESGAHALAERAPLRLDTLIENECENQQRTAEGKRITVKTFVEPVCVSAEAGLLTIVIRNLLDNAIRYSPEGSRIEIRCGRANGRIELTVSDNGPGIPLEDRDRVFERFYRVVGNEAPGSGLGLSIVRRIAELHGGSVAIRDGVGGRGTSIVVSFDEVEAPATSPSLPALTADSFSQAPAE